MNITEKYINLDMGSWILWILAAAINLTYRHFRLNYRGGCVILFHRQFRISEREERKNMASGLTPKQQREMFEMLDILGSEPIPCEEAARVEYLTEKLKNHDKTEPEYSYYCALLLWTLGLCKENYSSLFERTCAEHVVSALKDGNISPDDLPLGENAGSSFITTIINSYIESPDKSAADIEAVFLDSLAEGFLDLRVYHELRRAYAVSIGDFAAAEESIARFLTTERTEDSDCEGCEYDRLIKAHLMMGNLGQAEEYTKKIFAGRLQCESDIPEKTKIQAAYIAQRLGGKNAKKLLKAAVKKLYPSKYLYFEAMLAIVTAQDLNEPEIADGIVEMFRPVIAEHPYEVGSFNFYQAAWPAKKWRGNLDDAAFWRGCAAKYADEFDARNGNDFYHTQLK
jgi:hypothetical protein